MPGRTAYARLPAVVASKDGSESIGFRSREKFLVRAVRQEGAGWRPTPGGRLGRPWGGQVTKWDSRMASLLIERHDALLDITLNDPESGNLITADAGDEIIAALSAVSTETKLIRLRGNGPDFCRGRKSPPLDRKTATALEYRSAIAEGPLALYDAFKAAKAPIMGIVQGKAFGVGFALAALCDITLAVDSATFCIPELDHGIVPTLVMSALIGKLSPKAIAGLVLMRKPIDAEAAAALGVVTSVHSADTLEAEVDAVTGAVLKAPADALHAIRDYLRVAPSMDPAGARAFAANLIATVLSSRK